MPSWYQHATWRTLKGTWAPTLLSRFRVEARIHGCLPRPPFVLMADHANTFDPYVIGSFFPAPIRYMANIEGVAPWKLLFAEALGAYGRRKGHADLGALRRTLSLVEAGEAVGLFPEGDRSWDGRSEGVRPGAARLLRRLGVPLVLVRQKGSYLSYPRWATSPRKGRWSLDFKIFDAGELGRYSENLLDAVIAASLERDDVREAAREGRQFAAAQGAAEGVGRLLWRCPVCGKTDCIEGHGDDIRCGRCGASWRMNANLAVAPRNHSTALHAAPIRDLVDWHDWQVGSLSDLLDTGDQRGPGLSSVNVALTLRDEEQSRDLGRGTLRYRDGEILFEGTKGRAVFEARAIAGFVDNFNAFSEFGYRGQRWRAVFGGGCAAKWIYALRHLGSPGQAGAKRGEAA